MFRKILWKDLQNVKSSNVVLLILIALSTMMFASGAATFYYTSAETDVFVEESNVPQAFLVKQYNSEENQRIQEWFEEEFMLESGGIIETIQCNRGSIELPSERTPIPDYTDPELSLINDEVNLVFDENDQLFQVEEGHIAFPIFLKNYCGLKIGDEVRVTIGNYQKTFTISTFFKDAVNGRNGISTKRLMIAPKDFQEAWSQVPESSICSTVYLNARDGYDVLTVESNYMSQGFSMLFSFGRDVLISGYRSEYAYPALLVMMLSVVFILVSLLTLWFSVTSTVQDETKQIGIMKATGFKNRQIAGIYRTKYLFLITCGTVLGFFASFPFQNIFNREFRDFIVIHNKWMPPLLAFLASILLAVVIFGMCMFSLRSVSKITPMSAIHFNPYGQGNDKRARQLYLHRQKRLNPALFLSLSDIISGKKSFILLLLTFTISVFFLITAVSFNNALSYENWIKQMGKSTGDFYSYNLELDDENSLVSADKAFGEIERKLAENSEPVRLIRNYYLSAQYISEDGETVHNFQCRKLHNAEDVTYEEGSAPIHANEIAITTTLLERLGKSVGDTVQIRVSERKPEIFLITARFSALYSNMGESSVLSNAYLVPETGLSPEVVAIVDVPEKEKPEVIEYLRKTYPEIDGQTNEEFLDDIMGPYNQSMRQLILIVLSVTMLLLVVITSMFTRLFILKDTPIIAAMKSTGFRNRRIRQWQRLRILVLLLLSLIIAWVPCGFFMSSMGTGIFKPIQVFAAIPLAAIVLIWIVISANQGAIKKIGIQQMREE